MLCARSQSYDHVAEHEAFVAQQETAAADLFFQHADEMDDGLLFLWRALEVFALLGTLVMVFFAVGWSNQGTCERVSQWNKGERALRETPQSAVDLMRLCAG